MMGATANWLLQYAIAHVLASLLIVPVACMALRLRAIAPERRTNLLSLAFALVVPGPAIALQAGGLFAPTANAGLVIDSAASDLGAVQVLPAQVVAQGGFGIAPALAALLLAAWLVGASWHIARLLAAHVGLRRIVASSRRSRALDDACTALVPADVELLVSPAFGPAAVGLLRRRILLPQAMAVALPAAALRAVVLHEATHHRRNDVQSLFAQRLGEAVFWWNPLIRMLAKATDAAREVACDVRAARAFGTPTDYAEALLDSIAHLIPATQHGSARALCAAASLSTLDQRIDAIIEAPRSRSRGGRMLLPGIGGALMLLCIGASLAAPEIAVRQVDYPPSAVAMLGNQAAQPDEAALLALHDRYSQAVHERQDRYTQTLNHLADSYTGEVSALAEEPPDDGKEARLERLDERYRRLFADNESRARDAAAQAEANFLAARTALGNP